MTRTYLSNVNSKYSNTDELLHNALIVMAADLLSHRTYVPNVNSKYFNEAELLHNLLLSE